MCLRCLLALSTAEGKCYAVVHIKSLHQLAMLMPASVVSYEVQEIEDVFSPAEIIDTELFSDLVEIVLDYEHSMHSQSARRAAQ